MIIGVTDESVETVDKWIATKKKTGYPIVILDGKLEELLGVPHFPYAGVLGPDGKISYAGDEADGPLKKALKAAKPGSVWPKKLEPAAALLREGKMGEAWANLQALKAAGGLGEKEQQAFDKFSGFVIEVSGDAVASAKALLEKGIVYQAMKKAEPIASSKPPLPAAEDAGKLVAEMKALPTFDAEIKAGEPFDAALALEDEYEFLDAVNAYKDVAKKFKGTKIADVATSRAEGLVKKGMPGFERECEKCSKARKACEKHAKTVKL